MDPQPRARFPAECIPVNQHYIIPYEISMPKHPTHRGESLTSSARFIKSVRLVGWSIVLLREKLDDGTSAGSYETKTALLCTEIGSMAK